MRARTEEEVVMDAARRAPRPARRGPLMGARPLPFDDATARHHGRGAPKAARRAIEEDAGHETVAGGHPHDARMRRRKHEGTPEALRVELRSWIVGTDARGVVAFEGRDTAAEGGAIPRPSMALDPCVARVVARARPPDPAIAGGPEARPDFASDRRPDRGNA